MSHYYQGIVVLPASSPKLTRTAICRALRALRHNPHVDRWSCVKWWCKATLQECRRNMHAKESWARGYQDLPFTIRCYGNFCWTEMWCLALELARQSILHERSMPYPHKGPIFNEVVWMTMGETSHTFIVEKYLGTEEDFQWWDSWETEARPLKHSPM